MDMGRNEQVQRGYPNPVKSYHGTSGGKARRCGTMTQKRPNSAERTLEGLPLVEIAHENKRFAGAARKPFGETIELQTTLGGSKPEVRDQDSQAPSCGFKVGIDGTAGLMARKA
jgi:hypothetical protein